MGDKRAAIKAQAAVRKFDSKKRDLQDMCNKCLRCSQSKDSISSRSMLAFQPPGKLLTDSESASYQGSLCVNEEKLSPPSVAYQQPDKYEFSRKSAHHNPVVGTRGRKLSLPKAAKSKTAVTNNGNDYRRDKSLSVSLNESFEASSAALMFPDFFPRNNMFCYHADLMEAPNDKADPILYSWMLLFGHKKTN